MQCSAVSIAQTGLKFRLCSYSEHYSATVLLWGEGDAFYSAVNSSGGNIHAFIASGSRLLAPAENIVVCHSITAFLRLSQSAVFYIPPQHSKRPVIPNCWVFLCFFTTACQVTPEEAISKNETESDLRTRIKLKFPQKEQNNKSWFKQLQLQSQRSWTGHTLGRVLNHWEMSFPANKSPIKLQPKTRDLGLDFYTRVWKKPQQIQNAMFIPSCSALIPGQLPACGITTGPVRIQASPLTSQVSIQDLLSSKAYTMGDDRKCERLD